MTSIAQNVNKKSIGIVDTPFQGCSGNNRGRLAKTKNFDNGQETEASDNEPIFSFLTPFV